MKTITSQELRDDWLAYRDAAQRKDDSFVVTYFKRPVAAVISPGAWRRGLERVPHGDQLVELGARESRTQLAKLLSAARDGQHTLVVDSKRVGVDGARVETAVIVPHEWLLEALPEMAAVTTAGESSE